MILNIKNNETCRLADELAGLTGETKTGAISVALRERLEREQQAPGVEARLQRMRATRPGRGLATARLRVERRPPNVGRSP